MTYSRHQRQRAHEREDLVLVARVEVVGRLVLQQVGGLLHQRTGDERAR
ncbi:hypothetical protein R2Q81_06940 [Microbacterium aquimaris]|nr:hypothetical protein [Microbacterium aquimaris]MDZ8275687.1 hypothetical protein [Microbacterium aquimaris]